MDKNLGIAIKAALDAGKEIMSIYNSGEFNVEEKGDNSPLTTADTASNVAINEYLKSTDIPIISEENKQTDYKERKNWKKCWIVDPLDGTKEFLKRNGEFTVNIALIEDKLPVMGVIYVPAQNLLYYADKENAYRQKVEADFNSFDHSNSEKIGPKKVTDKIQVVGSRSHMNEETRNYISILEKKYEKETEVVSKGSSLKFCLVAEGKADVYPRFAPTMEWDTAAGQAICKAVGLKVIDQKTGEEMLYNREKLLNNYFLVSAIG
ncbi:3'(2'),5'-bisphosphate nucleotidase [Christiangramia fulva]|uniref:3'(2'),5'-bisphosphate nucleotidase CysQ n=1 Tax=Christiangramia fulva TaxID=2126553 RepID=A0A2R3Z9E3_9FLAO|nr:3'(2'),5'-bisphosphate nucleotidase CysQ [Christiangramia fulva]AVR46915.1 3'(2'),5'-bisphosphate nucleotidase [Christiangramia fulva]